ncbi:portal protein [Ferrovibrio sp.]|uniref:portal protein n=1 Tax=Ferrovibrio sp. TaxID=1917215 RepID=UPI003D0F6447
MTDRVQEIIASTDRMRARRSRRESRWQEILTYVIPMSAAITTADAMENRDAVIDNSGEQAHERLAAALVSICTPSIIDWFQMIPANEALREDDENAGWSQDCSRRMLRAIRDPDTGFAAVQHMKYQDAAGMALGCSAALEVPGVGIRFTSVPLRQVLIGEDAYGKVDTVHRDFELTALRAARLWGRNAGPKVLEHAADPKKADTTFRFVHAVLPNDEFVPGSMLARNLPLASLMVNVSEKHEIEAAGFHSMPYQTPRWRRRAGDEWGRGPGDVALADIKLLQRTAGVTIKGAENNLDPAWMLADDGIIGTFRKGNGRLNYARTDAYSQGRDPAKPLLTGARTDIGEEMMAGIRQRIDIAFFRPLIEMVRKDRMTATEVLEVKAEAARVMGPYLGNLQSEDLGPLLLRLFDIMERGGAFLPRPNALRGERMVPDYTSPDARGQRVAQARGVAQLTELMQPLIATKPDLLDNLDGDEVFRDTGAVLGLPQKYFVTRSKVAQIRQARADAQRAENERVAMNEGLGAAADAASALPAITQSLQSPTEALGGAA